MAEPFFAVVAICNIYMNKKNGMLTMTKEANEVNRLHATRPPCGAAMTVLRLYPSSRCLVQSPIVIVPHSLSDVSALGDALRAAGSLRLSTPAYNLP